LPIQARNAARSPLGRISLAGFGSSRGIPFDSLRVLGSYAIVYLVDGGGRFLDETGLELPVRAGDLLLVFPELAHAYGPVGDQTWTELWFCFDGPVFDLWRRAGLLDPVQPIRHLEPIEYWFHRFDAILGAPREPGYAPALLEVCRLQQVLAEALLGGAADGAAGADAAWAVRACALLEPDLERQLDLRDLASELGMSYDGFRKRFRQAVGLPPHRYRSVRLIDRACELMHHAALTNREIAERLGFCDEYYFSRRFKQVTGQSPQWFRASLPLAR
jgi:AraC-like DNA-binding protein